MEPISIEEAINITSGTRVYQKRIFLILMLGEMSLASFIMTTTFFLPSIDTDLTGSCENAGQLKNSATCDLDIIGDNAYQINVFRTIYFLSIMLGSWAITWLADKYGRKIVIKYCCLGGSIFLFIAAISMHISMLWIAAFGVGFLEIGFFITANILLLEMVDSTCRNLYSGLFTATWGFSAAVFTVFYMLDIHWRWLLIASSLLLLLEFFLMPFVHESPRFLLTNLAEHEATEKIMRDIARINGVREFSYTLLSENKSLIRMAPSFTRICGSTTIAIKLSVSCALWFSVILGYYGMIFIMPTLIKDVYLEGIAMYSAEIIATLVVAHFINVVGRKKTTIFCFAISGASFFAISAVAVWVEDSEIYEIYVIALSMVARLALSGEFYLIFIYTAELFPTNVRSSVFGICNCVGRISGVVSSYLFELSDLIEIGSPAALGIIMILAALLSLMLEETLGKKMLEIHEVEENEKPLIA